MVLVFRARFALLVQTENMLLIALVLVRTNSFIKNNFHLACPSKCLTCTDGSTCQSCESGFSLTNNLCTSCTAGTFFNTGVCTSEKT